MNIGPLEKIVQEGMQTNIPGFKEKIEKIARETDKKRQTVAGLIREKANELAKTAGLGSVKVAISFGDDEEAINLFKESDKFSAKVEEAESLKK